MLEIPIFRDSEYTKQEMLESERNLLGLFTTLKIIQDRINKEKQDDRLDSPKNTCIKPPNQSVADQEKA